MFVEDIFNFKSLLPASFYPYCSIAFSTEKNAHLNQERNMHQSSTVYKQKLSKAVPNRYICGWGINFSTGELWIYYAFIMDYGLEAMV